MNIVVAGHFPFPFGSASASRVRHISTGLSELGHRVFVITMVLVKSEADYPKGGDWLVHGGVRYFHAAGVWPPQRAGSRWRRVWLFLAGLRRGLAGAQRRIRALQRDPGVDVVIGYSDMCVGFHGLVRFCKRSGIPIVRDVVEWLGPDSFLGGRFNPLYWNTELGYRFSLPRSDGIIGISTFLTDWFEAKGLRTLRIPAVIDPQIGSGEAARRTEHPNGVFQLTYLGNMVWRDGPMLMLNAVREVISAGHDVFLNVVGATDNIPSAAKAKAFVEADELLCQRVRFWGRVSDVEVRRRLLASDALLFTRVSGRPAQAAFPTRLPEYLTTGNPVIASGVSDIPEYLQDGKDAIIVAPDSVSALAEGIIRLLSLPDRGRSIGQSGRQKCRECFNYKSHCREISRFLEQSIAGRG